MMARSQKTAGGCNVAKTKISSLEQFEAAWVADFRKKFGSSADDFEMNLRKKGIYLPFKLFYQYKLPGDLSPREFEKELKRLWGFLIFDTHRVQAYFDIDRSVVELLEQQKPACTARLKELVTEIQNLNKELSDIIPQNQEEQLSFVDGACYGFGPDEIKFHIERLTGLHDKEQGIIKKLTYDLEQILGKPIGYNLSPEKLKKILDVANARMPKGKDYAAATKKTKALTYAVDSLDRLDPTGYLRFMEEKGYGD